MKCTPYRTECAETAVNTTAGVQALADHSYENDKMAFRRRYRRRRYVRRQPYRSRRYPIRRPRRRMTRMTRRPLRTRRSILNLTSTKKRDNMPPLSIQDDPTITDTPGQPKTLSGDNNYGFLFCASARDHEWTEGTSEYARSKTITFCKGYSERITFASSSDANWLWRRIVFSTKDDFYETFPNSTLEFNSGTEGYTRTMWNFLGSDATAEPSRARSRRAHV